MTEDEFFTLKELVTDSVFLRTIGVDESEAKEILSQPDLSHKAPVISFFEGGRRAVASEILSVIALNPEMYEGSKSALFQIYLALLCDDGADGWRLNIARAKPGRFVSTYERTLNEDYQYRLGLIALRMSEELKMEAAVAAVCEEFDVARSTVFAGIKLVRDEKARRAARQRQS